jgi:hypothetical protein
VFGRVDETDEVSAVFLALEGSEIFEIKFLLVDDAVVVLVDVDPNGFLFLDILGD